MVSAGVGAAETRHDRSDALFEAVRTNVAEAAELQEITSIDHARLGAEAGSEMPPARVLIFSDAKLEADLVRLDPLIAIDLPLRVLAFETEPDGASAVIFNGFPFLEARYDIGPDSELEARYDASMSLALQGISEDQISRFASDEMAPNGIVTLDSPYDFETTVTRLRAAIDGQDDTVWFGEVDFQSRSAEQGVTVAPTLLLLFGAPAPGAKAMAKAPTLGLDAFCQKLLVWEDADGAVRVSYNDLLALADRQGVGKAVALRVINFRLNRTFKGALEPEGG